MLPSTCSRCYFTTAEAQSLFRKSVVRTLCTRIEIEIVIAEGAIDAAAVKVRFDDRNDRFRTADLICEISSSER